MQVYMKLKIHDVKNNRAREQIKPESRFSHQYNILAIK